MAKPSNSTVTIDGERFNAVAAHVGISTHHDHTGMPLMGSVQCGISFVVDMHDTANMPYATLNKLFSLANGVVRDKIKDIKVEFWTDESQTDAICTYTFQGWISEFSTGSGGGANHTLNLRVQPTLSTQHYAKIEMGN